MATDSKTFYTEDFFIPVFLVTIYLVCVKGDRRFVAIRELPMKCGRLNFDKNFEKIVLRKRNFAYLCIAKQKRE